MVLQHEVGRLKGYVLPHAVHATVSGQDEPASFLSRYCAEVSMELGISFFYGR